jgi:hypothetical protein
MRVCRVSNLPRQCPVCVCVHFAHTVYMCVDCAAHIARIIRFSVLVVVVGGGVDGHTTISHMHTFAVPIIKLNIVHLSALGHAHPHHLPTPILGLDNCSSTRPANTHTHTCAHGVCANMTEREIIVLLNTR